MGATGDGQCALYKTLTFWQKGNKRVECTAVVSPAMQAQHRMSVVRTPDFTSDLPPRDCHREL